MGDGTPLRSLGPAFMTQELVDRQTTLMRAVARKIRRGLAPRPRRARLGEKA